MYLSTHKGWARSSLSIMTFVLAKERADCLLLWSWPSRYGSCCLLERCEIKLHPLQQKLRSWMSYRVCNYKLIRTLYAHIKTVLVYVWRLTSSVLIVWMIQREASLNTKLYIFLIVVKRSHAKAFIWFFKSWLYERESNLQTRPHLVSIRTTLLMWLDGNFLSPCSCYNTVNHWGWGFSVDALFPVLTYYKVSDTWVIYQRRCRVVQPLR